MHRLAGYFYHDHVALPNPRLLQRNVMFNILYYMCRRGQENLYEMRKDRFEVKVNHESGEKFVVQVKDKLDKKHHEDDYKATNEGKMYDVPGQ